MDDDGVETALAEIEDFVAGKRHVECGRRDVADCRRASTSPGNHHGGENRLSSNCFYRCGLFDLQLMV